MDEKDIEMKEELQNSEAMGESVNSEMIQNDTTDNGTDGEYAVQEVCAEESVIEETLNSSEESSDNTAQESITPEEISAQENIVPEEISAQEPEAEDTFIEEAGNKGRKKSKKVHKEKSKVRVKNISKVMNGVGSSIKYKLVGAFLIPVILIIILGVVSFNVSASAITSSFKDSTESAIVKTADYYALMFANLDATASDIINNQMIQKYYSGGYASDIIEESNNYATIKSMISSSALGDEAIEDISIIGSYGKPIVTGTVKLGDNVDYKKLSDSAEGKIISSDKSGHWFTSREYIDSLGKSEYGLSYGRQIIGTSKRGVGYMFIDVSKKYIAAPLEDIDLGVDSIIALIAPDGGEIVTSNYIDIDENKTYFTDKEFYGKLVDSEDKGSTYVTYDGKKQLFIYSKLESGFTVAALIPESEIVAKASSIGVVSVVVVIIAIAIAILVGGFFAFNMSKVIGIMMKNLERAASGDLTVNMEVVRKDEFAKLALSTQGMIDNFKELLRETKEVSATVDQSSAIVTESSKQMLLETKEITASIEEIERGVVQQAEDSEDCLRQMDDLSDKINIVSENSGKIGQIAEETSEIVANGIASINDLKEDANSTVKITHQVIEEIQQLKEASKSIGNIIEAINEIASQTNLLSLNASIEAARAGDAGRGFAVVASEIRKLADQSVSFAGEIQKIVEGINSKTNDTVNIAKKAEDVVAVQVESLDNATQVFNDIQSQFNELMGHLEGITLQIDQIADSKVKTIDAISSISAVSQQTAAASEEVTETANRQVAAMESLSRAAEDLEVNSANLRDAINIFKV